MSDPMAQIFIKKVVICIKYYTPLDFIITLNIFDAAMFPPPKFKPNLHA